VVLVLGFGYVFLMIPETKGLELEEVDEMYRTRIPAWRSAGWKPSTKEKRTTGGHLGLDLFHQGGNSEAMDETEQDKESL